MINTSPNSNQMEPDGKPKRYRGLLPKQIGTDYSFKRKIVWVNAIGFLVLHLGALYGFSLVPSADYKTFIWTLAVALAAGEGVTIGAHRMYAHKAFKGIFITRLALVLLHTVAGQNCMWVWVRDHRQHHKYSDTDADPHNANRGFFFSHVGWLMSRKHPAVIDKGKAIDMSDLEADWLVMFQQRHYMILYIAFAICIPISVPIYLWDETYWNSFFMCYLARNMLVLNFTWLVNSAAHLYGTKPFDKFIKPVESEFVAFVSAGEGWHNYHHAFPWDYRAAELGSKYNLTTFIIDILAVLGFVYDLKTTPYRLVAARAGRTGDGSRSLTPEEARRLELSAGVVETPYGGPEYGQVEEHAEIPSSCAQ